MAGNALVRRRLKQLPDDVGAETELLGGPPEEEDAYHPSMDVRRWKGPIPETGLAPEMPNYGTPEIGLAPEMPNALVARTDQRIDPFSGREGRLDDIDWSKIKNPAKVLGERSNDELMDLAGVPGSWRQSETRKSTASKALDAELSRRAQSMDEHEKAQMLAIQGKLTPDQMIDHYAAHLKATGKEIRPYSPLMNAIVFGWQRFTPAQQERLRPFVPADSPMNKDY